MAVIFHDDEYGLITWKEQEQYGRSVYTTFGNPDCVKPVEAMHCIGRRIQSAEEPAALK